jgi:hypothetical protein
MAPSTRRGVNGDRSGLRRTVFGEGRRSPPGI